MDLDSTIECLCEKFESATDLLRNVSEEFGQVISDKVINLEARWELYKKYGHLFGEKLSDITDLKSAIDFTPYLPKSDRNLGSVLYNKLDIQRYETVSLERVFERLSETGYFEEDESLTDPLKEVILSSNVYSFVFDW